MSWLSGSVEPACWQAADSVIVYLIPGPCNSVTVLGGELVLGTYYVCTVLLFALPNEIGGTIVLGFGV